MLDPVIKVRHKPFGIHFDQRHPVTAMALLFCGLVTFLGTVVRDAAALCDKTPSPAETFVEKMSGDNGFSVGVVGSPTLYRPGQTYTLTLEVGQFRVNCPDCCSMNLMTLAGAPRRRGHGA